MSKIIFFDIDGTLWDEKMQMPKSTERAIKELKENGHIIFLCSGRAKGNIRSKHLWSLGFDGVIAACGNYIEMNHEVLFENVIKQDTIKYVIELLRRCHMPVVLEGPKFHWIDEVGFEKDPYVDYLFQEMGESAIPLRGYEENMHVNKFSADILPNTDYHTIKQELESEFDFIEHDGTIVEVVPKGTSKATGIAWLCNYLGISKEDTYAVGDSVNDLDMLCYVSHGIAMGNASQPAKDAAEFVTADIHNDGLYLAMKHYNLI